MTGTGNGGDPAHRRRFRGDIEGMRALAVLLVLLSHAGPGILPGGYVGVDVFFVISGFLITGLLVAELERTGRISLVSFYARRAKRLLPAAGLVLAVCLPLTLLCLPRYRWSDTGWDVVASGLYAMNWRLAEQAVDYLAADQAPSILQHYWSLAVEEQFYLIWPVLLLLIGGWAVRRGTGGRHRTALVIALGLVAVPSFAWSVLLTSAEPGRAYFVTTTRLWELALGGALALLGGQLARLPGSVATALGWAGLGGIVAAAVALGPATPFPGYAALLPTLGAAAVIAGGPAAGRSGPGRILDLRPVRAVGALSYSLYLWHWPLLVAAGAWFGALGTAAGLAVVTAAGLPAYLTYRYVEHPIRTSGSLNWQPGPALRVGAFCTALPVLAGVLFQFTVWPPAQSTQLTAPGSGAAPVNAGTASRTGPPGAAVLRDPPRGDPAGRVVNRVDSITPDPLAARTDLPDVYPRDCLTPVADSQVRTCVYGDDTSRFTVALAGDSHAANWIPALQDIASEKKWRLVTYLKASCPFLRAEVATLDRRRQPSCAEWNDRVRAAVTGPERPNLLLTSSFRYLPVHDGDLLDGPAGRRELAEGMRRAWSEVADAGIRTVVLRDTPYLNLHVAECVSANPRKLSRCAVDRDSALAGGAGPAQERAVDGLAGVSLLDLNDAICPADRCAPVIGGVLVYRDTNHLTATYARTLGPRLLAALDPLLG